MNKLLLLICIVFYAGSTQAQQGLSFNHEINYTQHLIDNNEFDEALYNLQQIVVTQQLTPAQHDTLHYYKAWALFNKQVLDSAAHYFNLVSNTSTYYYKSKFHQSFTYLYTKQYAKANICINTIVIDTLNAPLLELKNVLLASIALTSKDYLAFGKLQTTFTYRYFATTTTEQNLVALSQQMREFKHKSPLVAATLSAIVPGLGKIYAGQKGGGITAMLTVGALGAVLAENIYRAPKLTSANVIVTATLFTIFYTGNIVGSTYATKIKQETFFNNATTKIAQSLYAPMRTMFN